MSDYIQENEYRSIISGVGWIRRSDSEFLILKGKDVIDFINRISTNELKDLHTNGTGTTVLVTDKARIIDVVTLVYHHDQYFLEASTPIIDKVKNWIEKFIIAEDVTVLKPDSNLVKFSLFGSQANSIIKALKLAPENYSGFHTLFGSVEVILYRDPLFIDYVWNLYVPENYQGEVETFLLSARAQAAHNEIFETYRVEQGSPIFGKELTELVNPLEADLGRYVSMTKGCYLGQEVIARIHAYNKLQRKLTRVSLTSQVNEGSRIFQGGANVGWITSVCYSPLLGKWVGLGYLKTQLLNQKLRLRIDNGDTVYAEPIESIFQDQVR
jgi:folate-binding protein YgfZ